MNPNAPSHESVTQRAQQIWRERGCPSGQDTEIWLEAERQLAMTASAHNAPSRPEGRGNGNSQSGLSSTDPQVAPPTHDRPADAAPHPTPSEAAALASQQKKSARAPKQPAKIAPKAKPTESGKPIWDKPHSS